MNICCIFCKTGIAYNNLLSLCSHRRSCQPYRDLNSMGPAPDNFASNPGARGRGLPPDKMHFLHEGTKKYWDDPDNVKKQHEMGLLRAEQLREAQKLSAPSRTSSEIKRFVYVIKFDSNIVKVGSTSEDRRIERFIYYSGSKDSLLFKFEYNSDISFIVEQFILDNSVITQSCNHLQVSEGESEFRDLDSVLKAIELLPNLLNSNYQDSEYYKSVAANLVAT